MCLYVEGGGGVGVNSFELKKLNSDEENILSKHYEEPFICLSTHLYVTSLIYYNFSFCFLVPVKNIFLFVVWLPIKFLKKILLRH